MPTIRGESATSRCSPDAGRFRDAQGRSQTHLGRRSSELEAVQFAKPGGGWRLHIYTVIVEADTGACKLFDVVLTVAILTSVGVVILDSVEGLL